MKSVTTSIYGSVFLLLVFGFVMRLGFDVPGASPAWAQVLLGGVGVGVMVVLSRVDLRKVFDLAPILMLFALVLLFLPLIPCIGIRLNGRAEFLHLGGGLYLHPEPIAQLAVLLFLAAWGGRKRAEEGLRPWIMLAVLMAAILPIAAAPNFTNVFILYIAGLIVLGRSGHWQKAIIAFVVFLSGIALLITREPNRFARFLAFYRGGTEPESHPIYHHAIQAGGWNGLGLGKGDTLIQIPGGTRDYMAAHIVENLGLITLLGVLTAISLIVVAGHLIARHAPDRPTTLLAHGIVTLLALKTFVHIAAIFEWLPLRPGSLPLVSNSATELILQLAALGILIGIALQTARDENSSDRNSCSRTVPKSGFWFSKHK